MSGFNGFGRAFLAPAAFAVAAGCGPQMPIAGGLTTMAACNGAGGAQCVAYVERRSTIAGWTAAELESAYALPSATAGKGQAVFVVDAYDNPNVAGDFAQYRSAMGLPAGTLTKYNQEGEQKDYPAGNSGWGLTSDLAVEMVSASCPNCSVDLIEANSNSWDDLSAAVEEAVRLGATIVSISFSGSSGVSRKAFDAQGVTFVAAVSDQGESVGEPAAFDSVVAVGGTVLAQATNRRGYTETVLSKGLGGCVKHEPKPSWQAHSRYARACSGRMANDVSAVAWNVAIYDSYSNDGWLLIGGTSLSAPFVAGVFGLAGNASKQRGGRTFWIPASHHAHLFEVSGERYSPAGGWGSPDGTGAF